MLLSVVLLPIALTLMAEAQDDPSNGTSVFRSRFRPKVPFKIIEKPKFVNENMHEEFLDGLRKRRPLQSSPTVDPMVTALPFSVFDFFTNSNNRFSQQDKANTLTANTLSRPTARTEETSITITTSAPVRQPTEKTKQRKIKFKRDVSKGNTANYF